MINTAYSVSEKWNCIAVPFFYGYNRFSRYETPN